MNFYWKTEESNSNLCVVDSKHVKKVRGLNRKVARLLPSEVEFCLLCLLQIREYKRKQDRFTPAHVSKTLCERLGFGPISPGTFYPTLTRLKRLGWLRDSAWLGVSDEGSKAVETAISHHRKLAEFGEACLKELIERRKSAFKPMAPVPNKVLKKLKKNF